MNRYIKSRTNILIVDDEVDFQERLSHSLRLEGYTTKAVGSGGEALRVLEKDPIDLVLLDLFMPGIKGITVLETTVTKNPDIPVVIISGKGTIDDAVEAMKIGAYDYIVKDFARERLMTTVRNALERRQLRLERKHLLDKMKGQHEILGKSPQTEKIKDLIKTVAPMRQRVLISGETGTGKELVARNISIFGDRPSQQFVKVNCAAIPKELIESELFGYMKGAFTGALKDQIGKFHKADGGILFLDEVGDMALATQAKFMRAIEEGEITRVGSATPEKVDVRIISATNKNLEEMVESGEFREDLYYRLNVFPIHLTPLRERKEDIPILTNHFLQHSCAENNRFLPDLSSKVLQILIHHPWKGNVRELQTVISRVVIFAQGGEVTPEDVVGALQVREIPIKVKTSANFRTAKDTFERETILAALIATDWNVAKAAKQLRLHRTTLYKKMHTLGISREATES